MRKAFLPILITVTALALTACGKRDRIGAVYPQAHWLAYETPEEAGWSSERLQEAHALWKTIDSDAFMVVYDGAVVAAWGDVTRRFMCHSVRKSFLSALYGIHAAEGNIDLHRTLEELGIDDEPPLTPEEKQAKIIHLLKCRSGVYHAAAYETPGMKERRPARGSKQPDEFWYYNNWDFNALCTIFERETGTRLFEEFERRTADPLEMEDFRLIDTYYHLERQHSIHPAYPFKMSARDMARFGLLYARNGRWNGTPIIPVAWIEATRRSYSDVPDRPGMGYGYMWWVVTDRDDKKWGMYSARGVGGQMIAVLPERNVVFVNRADTYVGKTTDRDGLDRLMDAVLDAQTSLPRTSPKLVPFVPAEAPAKAVAGIPLENYETTFRLHREEVFVGTIPYVLGDMIGHTIELERMGESLLVTDNLGQKLVLIPRSTREFELEDARIPVYFDLDPDEKPIFITIDASPAWKVSGVLAPR